MPQKKAPWFIAKHGNNPPKKKRKWPNPISVMRRATLAEYNRLRKKFLFVRNKCEVRGCVKLSSQVHHRRGRRGSNFLNIDTWMAICANCHDRVHRDPKWARENGYLGSFHS